MFPLLLIGMTVLLVSHFLYEIRQYRFISTSCTHPPPGDGDLQLNQEDPTAFPHHSRDVISAACPGSALQGLLLDGHAWNNSHGRHPALLWGCAGCPSFSPYVSLRLSPAKRDRMYSQLHSFSLTCEFRVEPQGSPSSSLFCPDLMCPLYNCNFLLSREQDPMIPKLD